MDIRKWQEAVHGVAREHGWWPTVGHGDEEEIDIDHVSELEKLALIHSEFSEALEEYRDGKPLLYNIEVLNADTGKYRYEYHAGHTPMLKPEGIGVEIADAAIRTMDLAGALLADLDSRIRAHIDQDMVLAYNIGAQGLPEDICKLHAIVSHAMTTLINEETSFDRGLARIWIGIEIFCEIHKIDLEAMIALKHKYNSSRPYRHGGKKC